MPKSATDVMTDIVTTAVIDATEAFKKAAGGVPNAMVRELNAIHANTAVADLPAEVRAAIGASVRAAFTRLLREGYAVTPASEARRPPPTGDRRPLPPRPRGPGKPPIVETKRRPPKGPGPKR